MTKDQALRRVAGTFAYDTYQARELAKQIPNVAEATLAIETKNRAACKILGILGAYEADLSLLH